VQFRSDVRDGREEDIDASFSHKTFVANMSLLWKGESGYLVGRSLEHHLLMPVADTVFFERGVPKTWLFTSKKSGRFLKKKAGNVSTREIIKAFGKRAELLFLDAVGKEDFPTKSNRLDASYSESIQTVVGSGPI